MDLDDMDVAYTVKDKYKDPAPPTDSWGQFLSMRFRKRKAFYDGLKATEQQMIWKELYRIEYFRDAFKDRKLSTSDAHSLEDLLEEARYNWNIIAFKRCDGEIAKCQGIETDEIEETKETEDTKENRENKERNYHILRAVRRRGGVTSSDGQFSITSEKVAIDLKNYNPDEPDYGHNGWLMAFEDGKRGIDDPRCYGKFPHQKISIRQLLYNKKETPLMRIENMDQLRYFHLPANNMAWVEEAMSRYYGEEKLDFGVHKVLNARSKAERLLKHELWRGQQRGGIDSPVHSRQIGSRFSLVPSAPFDSGGQSAGAGSPKSTSHLTGSSQSPSNATDIALFMPYLHWEIDKHLLRMSKIVQRRTAELRPWFGTRGIKFRSKFADIAGNWRIKVGHLTPAGRSERVQWIPSSALGKYLWFAAKLFEIIDEAADERLISEHLHSTSPLHMRRTLDQFYYCNAIDTTARDHNQVVCRGTRSSSDPEATGRVVMVDQLWMWILDQNTIITSFPRRWGRNKPDPSAVHRAIRDHFGRLDSTQKRSIYDLALVIIDECSRVFFDRTKPLDQRPEVVTIFVSAISDIAEMKMMAYERFGRDVNAINARDSVDDADELIRKSLNISFEWSVLIEAQHIIDELQIMQEIFKQQIVVIRDFEKALESIGASSSTLERAAALIRNMEARKNELASLEELQAKTMVQLQELLDMKQQHAGIVVAKAAIERANESVLQGRSIVIFTVFTIFFLPLSFLASVFGMNARELNSGMMPLSAEIKYMFALSSVVIFFSLAFAFSTWARTVIAVGVGVLYAYVTHWMEICNIPILTFSDTSKLKEFEKETVNELRRRANHREAVKRKRDESKQRRDALKRISEINAAINEVSLGDQDRRSSWRTRINRIREFQNRRTTSFDPEFA